MAPVINLFGEPAGVVGDASLGDQLTAVVDDSDVVTESIPQNSLTFDFLSMCCGYLCGSYPVQDAQRSTYEARWPSLR